MTKAGRSPNARCVWRMENIGHSTWEFLDIRHSLFDNHLSRAVSTMPAAAKIKFGSHAASQPGRWPLRPKARLTFCKTKYAKQMKMLPATPKKRFRRPDCAPNGIAISTTTRHVHGAARRP